MKKKEQRTLQKTEQKKKEKQVLLTKTKQRLDLKQNLRSLLILIAFTSSAIAGRAALQHVPSVETVTPFSILAGFVLGPIYGLITGASSFYASNFVVWGGQGPWTIFQMIGAGLAGFIGGVFGKIWRGVSKHNKKLEAPGGFKLYMIAVVLGILVYELVVDVGWSLIFVPAAKSIGSYVSVILPMSIITALPFTATHLLSSMGICAVLWKYKERVPELGAKLLEKTKLGFTRIGAGLDLSSMEQEQYRVEDGKEKLLSKFAWKKKIED